MTYLIFMDLSFFFFYRVSKHVLFPLFLSFKQLPSTVKGEETNDWIRCIVCSSCVLLREIDLLR